jgi:hypothetical protein
MCLKGDDPLTTVFSKGTAQRNHEQTISFATSAPTTANGFTLTFKDLYGASWTTRPIYAVTTAWTGLAGSIEAALEALPNQVVKDVTVTDDSSSATDFSYKVVFEANSGAQNLLTVNTGGCNVDGCQPRIAGLTTTTAAATTGTTLTGTTEANECSGRGNCDSETGICECTEGFTGEACEQQTVLL